MPRPVPRIRFRYPIDRQFVGHKNAVDGYAAGYDYEALLVSEPHWQTKSGGWSGPYGRGGGPFWQESAYLRHQGRITTPKWFYFGVQYGETAWQGVGRLYADQGPPYFGSSSKGPLSVGKRVVDAQADLRNLTRTFYTKGILRTRPGTAQGSLGQFLAELKEIPSLPGRYAWSALRGVGLKRIAQAFRSRLGEFASASGSELLNYEFGWRPFLKDFRDFYSVTKALDSVLAKLIKENDKRIRRRATLESDTVITPDVGTPWAEPYPMWGCGGYGSTAGASGWTSHTATTTKTTKTWFSAGYRYSIRDTSSWLWKGKAVAVLFGVLPTPKLLYDITPWTWLLNWTGEVDELGNWLDYLSPTAVDALVTNYAFTMRKVVTTEELTSQCRLDEANFPTKNWPGAMGVLRSLRISTTKQRGTGWSPFGNSYPSQPLTKRQTAILAALGVTRVIDFRPY